MMQTIMQTTTLWHRKRPKKRRHGGKRKRRPKKRLRKKQKRLRKKQKRQRKKQRRVPKLLPLQLATILYRKSSFAKLPSVTLGVESQSNRCPSSAPCLSTLGLVWLSLRTFSETSSTTERTWHLQR